MSGSSISQTVRTPSAPARARAARRIRQVEDHHVAAVAAVALQPPSRRGVLRDGADHLDEAVADREHGVGQAEQPDTGVAERIAESERALQGLGDGLELPGPRSRPGEA